MDLYAKLHQTMALVHSQRPDTVNIYLQCAH